MTIAHLHLVLNHVPIVGLPVALLFLGYGLWNKNLSLQRFALWVLVGLAAVVVPVFLTGEPAEELVEHLPGVAESLIESHEEAATVSLILTLVAGAFALLALWFQGHAKRASVNIGVMGLTGVAILSLIYTGNLGGQIRHTELRAEAAGANNESGHDD